MPNPIFHIAVLAEFRCDSLTYEPESLASNGFIHCVEAHQVMKVAQRKFLGRKDAVLLRIDPAKVSPEIRYESLSWGRESFPHIYGALNSDAITVIEPMQMSDTHEAFERPACLK